MTVLPVCLKLADEAYFGSTEYPGKCGQSGEALKGNLAGDWGLGIGTTRTPEGWCSPAGVAAAWTAEQPLHLP